MKLLITGASGLYGSKLAEMATYANHKVFSVHNQHPAIFGTPIQLEITDKAKVETTIANVMPDVIVHAATLTDVDKCELNRELAWKINVEGTLNIVQAAKLNDAFLLYISTDYVFDGEKGNYTETDLPSPINFYGYTKLKAEEAIKKAYSSNKRHIRFDTCCWQNQFCSLASKQTKKSRTNKGIY